MRLELRVSGGMAGVRRAPVELETRERADGPDLEALAAQVVAQEPAAVAGADRFQYDLTVDGRTLRLHEGALTPEATELIARLRA